MIRTFGRLANLYWIQKTKVETCRNLAVKQEIRVWIEIALPHCVLIVAKKGQSILNEMVELNQCLITVGRPVEAVQRAKVVVEMATYLPNDRNGVWGLRMGNGCW